MKESSEFNKEMNKCNNYDKYVGMDVHKNSISVAVAAAGCQRQVEMSYSLPSRNVLSWPAG